MNTQITTKFKIRTSANEVFEAIVDPKKIGNYWFSSSSERWEQGKKITLRYDEYEAEGGYKGSRNRGREKRSSILGEKSTEKERRLP